jgi:predicted DNA-binding mobile mystery protein A
MRKSIQKLAIVQMDEKMENFKPVKAIDRPSGGWIKAIRTSLNMSIRQYALRLRIAANSARDIEEREKLGTISLNALRSAGQALNMEFVYGFIPKDGSLDAMINRRAMDLAREIVKRTNTSMKLEDQQVKKERLEKAVTELADEIKKEMPRYLWD